MIVANWMKLVVLFLAILSLGAGCGGGGNVWLGTYANANGSITLDVKNGGKASITLIGQSQECPYSTQADKTLTLDCPEPAGKLEFTRQSDGSVIGPGLVGRLTKSQR